MVTISACLIVKNEEAVLERCLESLRGIVDEIIIADTGSTDRTKEIAEKYTSQIYDFPWINDFSAARNFVFSKATKDYIYSADADEMIDAVNQKKFLQLKQVLVPEIELVQMIYVNPKDCNMVYNYERELRPKLFKRQRSFRWIDPIHETVALEPLVFDSEIEVLHLPQSLHSKRDFRAMKTTWEREERLSGRLISMYAKELFISGEKEDFLEAGSLFERLYVDPLTEPQHKIEAACVLAKKDTLCGDRERLFGRMLGLLSQGQLPAAELAFLLAEQLEEGDPEAAIEWYRRSAETESYVSLAHGGVESLKRMCMLLRRLERMEEAEEIERIYLNDGTDQKSF